MLTRRNLLRGASGLIAAPFVARAGVLMPVRRNIVQVPWFIVYEVVDLEELRGPFDGPFDGWWTVSVADEGDTAQARRRFTWSG